MCAKASHPEWRSVLAEIRLAIREHTLKTSNLATAAVVTGRPQIIRERRGKQARPTQRNEHARDDQAHGVEEWRGSAQDASASYREYVGSSSVEA